MEREHNLDWYVRSPWTKWYDQHKKPSTDYSIMEYKEMFDGKRPEWALTFSERKIGKNRLIINRYKKSFIIPSDSKLKSIKFWYIERERVIADLNIKRNVVVERILDASGYVQQVSLIHILGRGIPNDVHIENKLSKGVWVASVRNISDNWTNKNYSVYLKLSEPWSIYF